MNGAFDPLLLLDVLHDVGDHGDPLELLHGGLRDGHPPLLPVPHLVNAVHHPLDVILQYNCVL